jgi:Ion channel
MIYIAIGTILLLAIVLKLWTILKSIRWIRVHGEKHAAELRSKEANRKLTEDDFLESFANHRGYFFPFGVKQYKLRLLIRRLRLSADKKKSFAATWMARSTPFVLEKLHVMLFQYRGLSITATLFTTVVSIVYYFREDWEIDLPDRIPSLVFAIAIGTLVMNFGSSLQFIFGQLFLSDYARYFHMLQPHHNTIPGRTQLATNLRLILLLAFATLTTGFAAVLAVYLMFNGFGGGVLDDFESVDLAELPIVMCYCAYYVLSTITTTGFGDMTPTNPAGVLVSTGLQIEAFTLVIFVFEVFWASRFTRDSA